MILDYIKVKRLLCLAKNPVILLFWKLGTADYKRKLWQRWPSIDNGTSLIYACIVVPLSNLYKDKQVYNVRFLKPFLEYLLSSPPETVWWMRSNVIKRHRSIQINSVKTIIIHRRWCMTIWKVISFSSHVLHKFLLWTLGLRRFVEDKRNSLYVIRLS